MNHFVCTIGEVLVEVMRTEKNIPLSSPGQFVGPYPSGAPAIFIDALAKLGVSTGMIGSVGDDGFGKVVTERLLSDGVDISQIEITREKTTGTAFVAYNDDGTRQFLFHVTGTAAGNIYADKLNLKYLKKVSLLHLTGSSIPINENTRKACYKAAEIVKNNGGLISFDPNIRPEILSQSEIKQYFTPVLQLCDYVLPSSGEAELITGTETLEDAVDVLLKMGIKAVICKKGGDGCSLFTNEEELSVKAFPIEVVDPTGAGDCFSAGVIYGILQGWSWKDTLIFANAVGALSTTKQGPMEGCATFSEVKQFIQNNG